MSDYNDLDRKRFRHPDANEYEVASSSGQGDPAMDEGMERPLGAPMPRHQRPRKPRSGLSRVIGILLLLTLVGTISYGIFLLSIVAKISTNSWQLSPVTADSAGRTNVLVLGVGDPGHAGQDLSDTIMVLSFDKGSHRIAQISVPRDLRVTIPGYGNAKINAANADGGVALAEQTVSNTLGVPIDYYVTTNFSGLKDIVDAVGGLDVTVKDRLVDTEYPCDDNQYRVCGLDIKPGAQHMNGTTALQYVRCRKGTCGNDFGRAARQQEVLDLLRPKLADPELLLHPARLKALATALQKGIKTDMGIAQMSLLANRWRADAKNDPVHLVLSTSTGGYLKGDPAGTSDLLPIGGNFSAISDRVKQIFETTASDN